MPDVFTREMIQPLSLLHAGAFSVRSPQYSGFAASRMAVARMGAAASEFRPFLSEPPQMSSGAAGKAGYLSLAFEPSRLSACNLPPEFAMVEEDGDLMHYFGRDSSVAIPETVRAVKAFSFCGSETLESVSMPDSTNVIESGAFSWCSKLRSVRCSSGLQKIGAFAFDDCHSLEEIELPDSLEEINSGAFRGCSSLRLISMSAKTKIVGYESGHFADVDPSIVRIR